MTSLQHIISFFLVLLVFGLLPIWVVELVLFFKADGFSWTNAIKDGGLFLFSTTTLATSIHSYYYKHKYLRENLVSRLTFFSMFAMVVLVVCFMIEYITAFNESRPPQFVGKFSTFQTGGMIYSFFYATLVEAHTYRFSKDRNYNYRG